MGKKKTYRQKEKFITFIKSRGREYQRGKECGQVLKGQEVSREEYKDNLLSWGS